MTARLTIGDLSDGLCDLESYLGDEGGFSVDEIEAAYARALEAVDAIELAIPELAASPLDEDPAANETSGPVAAQNETNHLERSLPAASPDAEWSDSAPEHSLQPHHVIEAALFVGGGPLTVKRLAGILGQESHSDVVEQAIARLNDQYRREERPYEIRLQEGGYEFTLRPEFERIRDRVYGRNPKEVKLSQEALEVLAFVAYRQPVRCQDIQDAGKSNAAALLKQLLRRQLVLLHRSEDKSGDVTYSTTPRFLELFGLRHLDELPLPEDLELK